MDRYLKRIDLIREAEHEIYLAAQTWFEADNMDWVTEANICNRVIDFFNELLNAFKNDLRDYLTEQQVKAIIIGCTNFGDKTIVHTAHEFWRNL